MCISLMNRLCTCLEATFNKDAIILPGNNQATTSHFLYQKANCFICARQLGALSQRTLAIRTQTYTLASRPTFTYTIICISSNDRTYSIYAICYIHND